MAPTGVSGENVNMLLEFLGVTRVQATILLEKYGNVEHAVNQYFEDPTGSVKPQPPADQWVEADSIPLFRIDAVDTTELPMMSRPPSRVENRVADVGAARPQTEAGISSDDEMQDLQRAIAMSKQDLSGQETGTLESGQQFGPANRPYYDSSQWAMTTITSSREVVDHPPPLSRQRVSGHPAFLRGTPETGYLAPLLNIYHSIPLAREAFLLPSMKVLSYGYDPQWWSGISDENTKSISIESSERNSQDRHNFLSELQCLMAFLDGTNRAYGSVDALADLRAMKMYSSESQLSRLLETWVAAAMIQSPDNQLSQIFTSTAVKSPDVEGYSPIHKDLVCLEPTVRRVEGQTLVNMLDSTIWDDVADKIDDIWIHQCAEIFTMRLYDPINDKKGLGLEIPPVWYPDRYMYQFREMTRQWRREMLAVRYEINQCNLVQRRCEVAQGPGKRVIKIRDVLDAASKLAVAHLEETELPSASTEASPEAAPITSDSVRAGEVQSQIQAILQRIDEKVGILEARKAELQEQIRTIASQLTRPSDDPNLSPRHKYYLQGISTKPNITYVRRRTREIQTLIDTTVDEDGNEEFQWWRIAWGKDGHAHTVPRQPSSQIEATETFTKNDAAAEKQMYSVQTVSEAEVLMAAKIESNSIVLVYANENAMNFVPSAPAAGLRMFVEQDNRAFQDDIDREPNGNRRRYSQETNTTIMDDVALADQSSPNGLREMTPMSMTSPSRGADGQPSPKRAKGDESQIYQEVDSEDEPPPYHEPDSPLPVQEKQGNKIGMLADRMLEKYGGDNIDNSEGDEPLHIEHAREPLR